MAKTKISLESAKSTIKAVGANEFAKAIILGVENPAQNERPLTENQKCDVAAMVLMCYADFVKEAHDSLDADVALDFMKEI